MNSFELYLFELLDGCWLCLTTHLKSRANAVIKYTCECTITSKIRAGCELGRGNNLYHADVINYFGDMIERRWVKPAEILGRFPCPLAR